MSADDKQYRVNLQTLAQIADEVAAENFELKHKIATAQTILAEPILPNYDPQHRLDRIREALK